MIIDSHCHLIDEKFDGEVSEVIKRAFGSGVNKIITMAGGRRDWQKLIELSKKETEIFIALGWHPEDLTAVEDIADLEKLIVENRKCVAIGEVGMDFFYDKEKLTKNIQMEMLEKQIVLAQKLNKPLVIHVRSAEEEVREVMERCGDFRAQFHCFGESQDFLSCILERGHMVSFAGNITFKSATILREMVKTVPINQLLLETDSPYLAPEPLRGTRNEPANIVWTAQFIAKELKIEIEELSEQTSKNTICFFGLEN